MFRNFVRHFDSPFSHDAQKDRFWIDTIKLFDRINTLIVFLFKNLTNPFAYARMLAILIAGFLWSDHGRQVRQQC